MSNVTVNKVCDTGQASQADTYVTVYCQPMDCQPRCVLHFAESDSERT